MKSFRPGIMLAALLMCALQAFPFKFATDPNENIKPSTTISSDDTGVTVQYSFPGILMQEDDLFPGTFTLSIPGFGNNMTPGEPSWPTHWDSFEIPVGCDATVEVISHDAFQKNIKLAPAREPLFDNDDAGYSRDNIKPINHYSGWLPTEPVQNEGIQIYRDRQILYVGVMPVSYNMEEENLSLSKNITFRISYTSTPSRSKSLAGEEMMSANVDLMKSMFTHTLNDGTEEDIMQKATSIIPPPTHWTNGEGYLILSISKYSTAVNRLAAWKRQLGYNVRIINNDAWTPSLIKSTIASACEDNKGTQYLVLFGDEIDIPSEKHNIPECTYKFYSDFKYACLNGDDDELQDLVMGRISVTNLNEANIVVNKIINFEKNPLRSTKALFCAEFSDYKANDGYEDRRFVRTCEDILSGMEQAGWSSERIYFYNNKHFIFSPNPQIWKPSFWNKGNFSYGEPITDILREDSFNWSGTATDITASINNGVGLVLHRDHGEIQSWSLPNFTISNINRLSNENKTPIVFSMNCLTGMFKYIETSGVKPPNDLVIFDEVNNINRSTCFAEAFLRKSNGGCVGIIAASQISYSGFNDALTMEIFQKIWPSVNFRHAFPYYSPSTNINSTPIKKIGDVLVAGKLSFSQYYKPTSQLNMYTNYIFHWFGDPTLKMNDKYNFVEPNISIEAVRNQTVTDSYSILNTGLKVQLTRVNQKSMEVDNSYGSTFIIPMNHNELYRYYISAENIEPREVRIKMLTEMVNSIKIDDLYQTNGILKINLTGMTDSEKYSILTQELSTGQSSIHSIEKQTDTILIENGHGSGSILVVQLLNGEVIIDTQKIIIK